MTDGERQKGDGGRDFCNRQAPSNNLLRGLAVVAWPYFGPVVDENQAHRGTRMGALQPKRAMTNTTNPNFFTVYYRQLLCWMVVPPDGADEFSQDSFNAAYNIPSKCRYRWQSRRT